MGIDDFMTFCRLIGAEPYLAVNSGLGDAHSAAEEVEYVNGPATSRLGRLRAANGHPAPVRREDLGRRQRDVRPLAVGPHAHHAVRGEAQPDGQGDAKGRPDHRGDRLRRDARGGVLVLHREPAARHVPGARDGERAAAVRVRLEPGLDRRAAEDLRRLHRLPRRALLRLPQPGDRPGHAAVRPLRRAAGAQGAAPVEPGAVQVRGVGRVPEAVPPPEGQGHPVRLRRVVAAEPGARRAGRRRSTTRCSTR